MKLSVEDELEYWLLLKLSVRLLLLANKIRSDSHLSILSWITLSPALVWFRFVCSKVLFIAVKYWVVENWEWHIFDTFSRGHLNSYSEFHPPQTVKSSCVLAWSNGTDCSIDSSIKCHSAGHMADKYPLRRYYFWAFPQFDQKWIRQKEFLTSMSLRHQLSHFINSHNYETDLHMFTDTFWIARRRFELWLTCSLPLEPKLTLASLCVVPIVPHWSRKAVRSSKSRQMAVVVDKHCSSGNIGKRTSAKKHLFSVTVKLVFPGCNQSKNMKLSNITLVTVFTTPPTFLIDKKIELTETYPIMRPVVNINWKNGYQLQVSFPRTPTRNSIRLQRMNQKKPTLVSSLWALVPGFKVEK